MIRLLSSSLSNIVDIRRQLALPPSRSFPVEGKVVVALKEKVVVARKVVVAEVTWKQSAADVI